MVRDRHRIPLCSLSQTAHVARIRSHTGVHGSWSVADHTAVLLRDGGPGSQLPGSSIRSVPPSKNATPGRSPAPPPRRAPAWTTHHTTLPASPRLSMAQSLASSATIGSPRPPSLNGSATNRGTAKAQPVLDGNEHLAAPHPEYEPDLALAVPHGIGDQLADDKPYLLGLTLGGDAGTGPLSVLAGFPRRQEPEFQNDRLGRGCSHRVPRRSTSIESPAGLRQEFSHAASPKRSGASERCIRLTPLGYTPNRAGSSASHPPGSRCGRRGSATPEPRSGSRPGAIGGIS